MPSTHQVLIKTAPQISYYSLNGETAAVAYKAEEEEVLLSRTLCFFLCHCLALEGPRLQLLLLRASPLPAVRPRGSQGLHKFQNVWNPPPSRGACERKLRKGPKHVKSLQLPQWTLACHEPAPPRPLTAKLP